MNLEKILKNQEDAAELIGRLIDVVEDFISDKAEAISAVFLSASLEDPYILGEDYDRLAKGFKTAIGIEDDGICEDGINQNVRARKEE